jgi:hypothetical protein
MPRVRLRGDYASENRCACQGGAALALALSFFGSMTVPVDRSQACIRRITARIAFLVVRIANAAVHPTHAEQHIC